MTRIFAKWTSSSLLLSLSLSHDESLINEDLSKQQLLPLHLLSLPLIAERLSGSKMFVPFLTTNNISKHTNVLLRVITHVKDDCFLPHYFPLFLHIFSQLQRAMKE